MPVDGDVWLSLSLAQMVPEIDPNNPGSAASLLRDKVNEVETRFQQTLSSANQVIAASSSLIGQVNVVGSALAGVQNGIRELAQNTGNTGVYFRLIGICPDFPNSLLQNTNEFANEVTNVLLTESRVEERAVLEQRLGRALIEQREAEERAQELRDQGEDELADQAVAEAQNQERIAQLIRRDLEELEVAADPCVPQFVGDTAYMGGIVGLVGAANPVALWGKLKVLAEIFPGLKEVIADAEDQFESITESTAEFLDTFSADSLNSLAERFSNFKEELEELGESPLFNADELVQTNGCDKWVCSRLKDIMPMLDVDRPGSAMNLALDFSDEVSSGLIGTLRRVANLQSTARSLIGEVVEFQTNLNSFKNKVFELGDNLASTGVFLHPIGRDGSVHNNVEFVRSVREALFDVNDPGRPTFRGDTAVVAGFLMVVGAPTVSGLQNEFNAVKRAINGFGGKIEAITEAAGRVEEAAKTLQGALSTSETDPGFTVTPTAPQRANTDSTLISAAEALIEGENPFTAASQTVETNKLVTVVEGPNGTRTKIDVEDTTTESRVVVADGAPVTQTPPITGETTTPQDSGAATLGIGPLARSARRLTEGLG